MIDISVVIPVYNRSELLEEALESVRNQTFKNYEIIVVDDGSDSVEKEKIFHICKNFDVNLVELSHCGRAGLVRNQGVKVAKGDYVAFLDSDDIWFPSKLEKQFRWLVENPEIPLVHTREKWSRNGTVVSQRKQRHQRCGDIFKDALTKCIIGPSTVVMKKIVFYQLGGFNENLEIAEDYEFWLRYTVKYLCGYIDENLIIKRAGNWDQLSRKYDQIEIFRLEALDLFLNLSKASGFDVMGSLKGELAVKEFIRKSLIYAFGCRKRGREVNAKFWEDKAKNWDDQFRRGWYSSIYNELKGREVLI